MTDKRCEDWSRCTCWAYCRGVASRGCPVHDGCPTCRNTGRVRETDSGGELVYETCPDCAVRPRASPSAPV
jgi:hypothetical protein